MSKTLSLSQKRDAGTSKGWFQFT